MHDVIIVGGSYAGLAAALQLGRARRSVLVIDSGTRRNRFTDHSHGYLTQDGASAAEIASKGKAEALAYPTVKWTDAAVTKIEGAIDAFSVQTDTQIHRARRIVLATGVSDELPEIPGISARWGQTVFACPYCDGYERQQGRLAILATHPLSLHHAQLVAEWAGKGRATFFLNGAFEPDDDQMAALAAREIRLERARVTEVLGDAPTVDVRFGSDADEGKASVETFDGLFLLSRMTVNGPFAAQLGCEIDSTPIGQFYKTDATKETTVPGVFACGDVALPFSALTMAVADGVRAGVSAHQSLVFPKNSP